MRTSLIRVCEIFVICVMSKLGSLFHRKISRLTTNNTLTQSIKNKIWDIPVRILDPGSWIRSHVSIFDASAFAYPRRSVTSLRTPFDFLTHIHHETKRTCIGYRLRCHFRTEQYLRIGCGSRQQMSHHSYYANIEHIRSSHVRKIFND